MAYFTSNLLPLLGAHPTSTSIIHLPSLSNSCSLHLYFSLPPVLFLDTHELSQRNSSYSFEYRGTRDLERPVHALPEEESELLVNVKIPAGFGGNADEDEATIVRVEVPMH
ncbi:hypothetical protein BJ912DRAFT_41325 [Pholiota molesta]|nr:hypothetical protein BJ912DRAFT_41325 [Pholiota molesta]